MRAARSTRRRGRTRRPYRGNYFFADYASQWIGRLDLANGNAAYAFASVGGSPVDMLVGSDGALYVLTRGAVTRISITLVNVNGAWLIAEQHVSGYPNPQ